MPPVSRETLYRYCDTVYSALEEGATTNTEGQLQWEGGFVALFSQCGISNAHYSRVTSALQELGCVEWLRKGARGVTSVIVLHRRPELSDLEREIGVDSPLTKPSPLDKLDQRVRNLERRLDGVDLKAYIATTEQRLLKVEGKGKKGRSAQ